MKIHSTKDNDIVEVLFTSDEALFVSTLIGSSYSGADQWRVPTKDYESKFGIVPDRADQLSSDLNELYNKGGSLVRLTLRKKEMQAIRMIIEYMLEKWDEEDFPTLTGTEKLKAEILLKQLNNAGTATTS